MSRHVPLSQASPGVKQKHEAASEAGGARRNILALGMFTIGVDSYSTRLAPLKISSRSAKDDKNIDIQHARAIVSMRYPSSSGCRKTSSTWRRHSGHSLQEEHIIVRQGRVPRHPHLDPPIIPTSEMVCVSLGDVIEKGRTWERRRFLHTHGANDARCLSENRRILPGNVTSYLRTAHSA